MANMQQFLPQVEQYVQQVDLRTIPGYQPDKAVQVVPLAQGEYNMNYRIRQGPQQWVIRVNIGTQINRTDQITYEYKALRLLAESGVTPQPFYVDDSRELLPHGVLIMAFLPGSALDYGRDRTAAARLFARIHSHPIAADNHLIRETRPLSMTFEECNDLLRVYLESELADPAIRDYMIDVLAWASEKRYAERYFLTDPWPCVINTEVNSGNFIANRGQRTFHLVDWEKPLWGDPSQDLSHFCVPTTTLWKTNYRMSEDERQNFLKAYKANMPDPHLRNTIEDRVRLRDPFNCLRGISWSAMAWVRYQTGQHALQNNDTFQKVCQYLDMDFLRSLFDQHLHTSVVTTQPQWNRQRIRRNSADEKLMKKNATLTIHTCARFLTPTHARK